MSDEANRRAAERMWEALQRGDVDAAAEFYQDDAVQEWPQSGERIVGRDNILAVYRNYPAEVQMALRRILGSGDVWIGETTIDYGQGDPPWNSVSIVELRDGKIARQTDYFGEPFQAPEWRSQWVERM